MAKSIECPSCGNVIYATDEKCPYCGTKNINKANNNYVQPVGQNYPQNISYPRGKKVNKIVYILLAILLGGIGAHKFYAGKFGQGLLYLFFCLAVIPSIIGIIEGILAIEKQTDENGDMYI